MKEQRTAPPSLNQPLPHSHEPLLDDAVFSWYWYWYWYWYWKEKLIEIEAYGPRTTVLTLLTE